MKRYRILLLCIVSLAIKGCSPEQGRPSGTAYEDWPVVNFRDVRIIMASEPLLANKGFAIAREGDFEKTIMIFPNIEEGTMFVNHDQGYGAVGRDLKIAFLDSEMKVLKTDIMKKGKGFSVAPPGTAFAIEGLAP